MTGDVGCALLWHFPPSLASRLHLQGAGLLHSLCAQLLSRGLPSSSGPLEPLPWEGKGRWAPWKKASGHGVGLWLISWAGGWSVIGGG